MNKSLTIFSFVLLSLSGLAQSECGTVMPAAYQTTYAQRAQQIQPVVQGNDIVVPVHIHLIRESNGNSNLTLQQIQNELDSANFFYDNANLVFIECIAAEMIDDDSLYNYESSTDESYLLTNHHTPNVLNLYFANTVAINATLVCGYSWYPGGPDAAFISGTCATNGSTLAHEIGHYMGLPHTHGGTADELVDGSNCATEGDYICDTPADPGLSGLVDSACVYTGTAVDANNMAYVPDVNNIMSYSRKVCRNQFTFGQYAVINSTYWSDRTYLQFISTGANNEWVSIGARIFPNPAQDQVRILLNADAQFSRIEIFDATGRLVMMDFIQKGEQSHNVDVSRLANGTYTCKIIDERSDIIIEPLIITR